MAAVLDHCMGIACWVSGHPVVAANISINFHRSIPLGGIYTVETWVEKVEGKKCFAHGEIYLDDAERPYSTGTGLFIIQDLDRFKNLVAKDEQVEGNYDTVEKEMHLSPADLTPSREVLAKYGNMSSPTVLFVLKQMLDEGMEKGSNVFAAGFGPGLTLESCILQKG